MAMSGPKGSHHQDDDEFSPSVFSEINITPLTDIFLVLLIIFMVGSSIVVEQAQGGGTGVRVDLPKGAAKELHTAPRDFPVAILKDGTVVTEGKAIEVGALKEKFAKECFYKNKLRAPSHASRLRGVILLFRLLRFGRIAAGGGGEHRVEPGQK